MVVVDWMVVVERIVGVEVEDEVLRIEEEVEGRGLTVTTQHSLLEEELDLGFMTGRASTQKNLALRPWLFPTWLGWPLASEKPVMVAAADGVDS